MDSLSCSDFFLDGTQVRAANGARKLAVIKDYLYIVSRIFNGCFKRPALNGACTGWYHITNAIATHNGSQRLVSGSGITFIKLFTGL